MSRAARIVIPFFALLLLIAATVISSSHETGLPEDLASFQHVNTLVVPDTTSPIHGIHHFYANESALKTMKAGVEGGSYPDGATFVGVVFAPHKTTDGRYREGDRAAYTLMRKDAGNEATSETGGWHFVMFTAGGEKMDIDPVKNCFGCHQPHQKTDFVMSELLAI